MVRLGAVAALAVGAAACVGGGVGVDGDALCADGKCDGFAEQEPEAELGEGDERWHALQTHLHSTGMHECSERPLSPGQLPEGECYSGEGIASFLADGLDHGVRAMLVTDHNNTDAWLDEAFQPVFDGNGGSTTPLRGVEWTTGSGHMNLFFPRQVVGSNAEAFETGWMYPAGSKEDVAGPEAYVEAIEAVHRHGGFAIVNHPALLIHRFPEATFGADAVEIGVKRKIAGALQEPTATRRWWQRRLVEGDRITGLAGADHHYGGSDIPLLNEPLFGEGLNLIRTDPSWPTLDPAWAAADPQAAIDQESDLVADAILRGAVMVVRDLDAPRVYIGADADGDDRFHDARAGDCLLPEELGGRDQIRIRVRVTNAAGPGYSGHYNVRFWTEADADDEWLKVELDPHKGFEQSPEYERDPGDPFSVVVTVPVLPDRAQFFRVEVEHDVFGPWNGMEALTNPIYFGAWGAECD